MMNIGMIGAGRIGKLHAENIQRYCNNVTLKSIADPYIDKAWAKSLGIEHIDTQVQPLLQDSSIDAVLICSSSDTHAKYIIAAAQHGKHIFCEKPIAVSIEEARTAIDAANQHNVKLQVGFNRRFDRDFFAMQEMISAGKVGDVHTIRITSRDPEPPPLSYLQSSSDIFSDMSIHDFDMLRYLSGADVVSVYVNGTRLIDHEFNEPGYIDTAFINLTLSSGAIAVIENSRKAVFGYDQRVEVFGSGGALHNENQYPNSVVLDSGNGISREKPLYFFLERYKDSFVKELDYFFNAIATDQPVFVTAEDALQASLIAKACRLSADENRVVFISEV